ncbi:MAG: hypothetical protein ABI158_07505, partial [Edaphobacter sp.]
GYGWGWTPYRCGNWSYWDGFGWGWLPGSSCGFGGWGFGRGGGGYVINVQRPPLGYRFRPVPVHSPGQVHPIRVGRPVVNPVQVRPIRGPRTIAGRTVEPLRPVQAAGAIRGVQPRNGALQRDYPVDRVSRKPMLGKPAGSETATPSPIVVRPGAVQAVNPRVGSEGRETPARPMRSDPPQSGQRQNRPQQEQVRPQQQQVRPMPQSAPRYTPPVQPRNVPAPQPRYSPPPQPYNAPPPSAPQAPRSAPRVPSPAAPQR